MPYVVYLNGFDAGGNLSNYNSARSEDDQARWMSAAAITPLPDYARTGSGGIAPNGVYGRRRIGLGYLYGGVESSGYWNMGKALKNVETVQPPPLVTLFKFLLTDFALYTTQWELRTGVGGALELTYGGGSSFVTPTPVLPIGRWFSLEVRAFMSDAGDGYVRVAIDGVTVIDVSGVSTTVGSGTAVGEFGAPAGFYVDDLFVTWEPDNFYSYLGDVRVYTLFPITDEPVVHHGLPYNVSGASSVWDAVNDVVPDDDSTYIWHDDHRVTHEAVFSLSPFPFVDPPGVLEIGYVMTGIVRALHLDAEYPSLYCSAFTETSHGEYGQTYLQPSFFDAWTAYYIAYTTGKDTANVSDLRDGATISLITSDNSFSGTTDATIGFGMTSLFIEAAYGGCPYGETVDVVPSMTQIVG